MRDCAELDVVLRMFPPVTDDRFGRWVCTIDEPWGQFIGDRPGVLSFGGAGSSPAAALVAVLAYLAEHVELVHAALAAEAVREAASREAWDDSVAKLLAIPR